VGTITEIYDYLRLLFSRIGQQYCPDCGEAVESYTAGAIMEELRRWARKSPEIFVLSPMIDNAPVDGEELLERVEKSGFEWVTVNGRPMKINDLANFEFETKKPYDISLIVGKVTDFHKQDLAKMVDTALDLSNGLVIISDGKDLVKYSTLGLCPHCGKMMPRLDMRSFSFNSPYGACPRCTGLGITLEVDEELVIPNDKLTLAEGAIQPWMRITGNQNWYQKILSAVAERQNFSVNTPVKDLPARVKKMILYGTGEELYEVEGKKTNFTGVIPNLLQRHLETDSEYVRKEIEQYMRESICPVCEGKRLRRESLAVKIGEYNIADLSGFSVEENRDFFKKLSAKLPANVGKGGLSQAQKESIAKPIIKEILQRIESLDKVGLGYLTIDRSMNTLSGGEVTRTRLATQLSTGLIGVIYILDEPSVGLHPKDNKKLIDSLKSLRDLGNTVIVVEHDPAMMLEADYIIDVGPGAGLNGGEIIAKGTVAEIKKSKASLTGAYLSKRLEIECVPPKRVEKKTAGPSIKILGAKAFNLKNINAEIPLGKLVCVTGVSGSGKSSLIIDILGKELSRQFYRAKDLPGEHNEIKGVENIDKVIAIDQSPIGRTPRSNPATYTNVFTLIRDLFAGLPEAKMHGYDAGKFSFNVKGGGRCEACAGEGYVRIPMQFLADVYVQCGECGGARYNREALEIHYRNKNISDVLVMTVDEAYTFFNDIPNIADKLNILRDVGLGYMELGQPATTLSGGEAQRVKLATELARASTGKTLYILDEPTTGLHFEDIKHLLQVLNQLVRKGNTVVIIEHNLDVIRCADWIIDMGPGGGKYGGEIIAAGTPKDIIKNKSSWTGKYLKNL
jgi:excinuclease ABC subunit A